jgi:hypothetical protein
MADGTQKGGPTETVRIYLPVKNELEELILDKQSKERRTITQAEEVSKAVAAHVKRERRKIKAVA